MTGQSIWLQVDYNCMTTWEISFRIKYDYPLIRMSGDHPGLKVSMWCVWDREMIHVPNPGGDLMREIDNYIGEIGRSIEHYKESSDGYVLTLKCTCDLQRSVWEISTENHCVDVNPAVFLDGWGYFRVISFSEDDIKKLFSELSMTGEVDLLSKKKLHSGAIPSTVWTESFFSGLTEKQMDAVVKAFDYGYYSSPRGITTDSIATSLGVSRSTYEEHLRKAENRIMDSIIPYLKLFRAGSRKKDEIMSPGVAIVEARS